MMRDNFYFEDCKDTLSRIKDNSIDLIIQDPPYKLTNNKWDVNFNPNKLWPEWNRVLKTNGAAIFFAQFPFTFEMINSNIKNFKYDLIWEKDRPTGFLNKDIMPLRSHEHILIFYRKTPTYNPQKWIGQPQHGVGRGKGKRHSQNNYKEILITDELKGNSEKFPRSVWTFKKPHPALHPTQKPLNLIRMLIRTYSNPGDTVYDGYVGSGTTLEACVVEKRDFIGSENDSTNYDIAVQRMDKFYHKPLIF